MMKKGKIVLALVGLLGVSAFLLFQKIQRTQQKKLLYHSTPCFQLLDINGNSFTEEHLKKHRTVLFLFFNPDCEICREEMTQIKNHQAEFSQGFIVFFSTVPADVIRHFLQEMDFIPSSNMMFLSDEKEALTNKMEVKTSPATYIYRNNRLVKRFDGPVKAETLIRYLSEE